MALPSSRKPVEVEEYDEERRKEISELLKKKKENEPQPSTSEQAKRHVNERQEGDYAYARQTQKAFLGRNRLPLTSEIAPTPDQAKKFANALNAWYEGMPMREQLKLSPLKLKRKAISICYKLKVDYYYLPSSWIVDFEAKQKIKLRLTKKTERKRKQPKESQSLVPAQETGVRRSGRKKNGDGGTRMDPDSDVNWAKECIQKLKAEGGSHQVKPLTPASSSASATLAPLPSSSSASDDKCEEPRPEAKRPRTKKFIDLTVNHTPPPRWLKAYAKGIKLPRIMMIYSTEDSTYLYWDYTPKLQDSNGQPVKLKPQRRTCLM